MNLVSKRAKRASDTLISTKMHAKKLDYPAIANNIVTELDCGICIFNYQRHCNLDRAGSNITATKVLNLKKIENPVHRLYYLHAMNLPSKKFSKMCVPMNKFRKSSNKSMQQRSQLCKEVKKSSKKYIPIARDTIQYV